MSKFKSVNLETDLVEELKIWKQAFMLAYGRTVSLSEMIRIMIDNLDGAEPDILHYMDFLIKEHPELAEKIGKYRGIESEDENK
jgi:hypothetical protein